MLRMAGSPGNCRSPLPCRSGESSPKSCRSKPTPPQLHCARHFPRRTRLRRPRPPIIRTVPMPLVGLRPRRRRSAASSPRARVAHRRSVARQVRFPHVQPGRGASWREARRQFAWSSQQILPLGFQPELRCKRPRRNRRYACLERPRPR